MADREKRRQREPRIWIFKDKAGNERPVWAVTERQAVVHMAYKDGSARAASQPDIVRMSVEGKLKAMDDATGTKEKANE